MLTITKDDIFPPPKIEQAVPPTVRVLSALLAELSASGINQSESDEDDARAKRKFDLLFSRACVYLRADDIQPAIADFSSCLELQPENVKARGNLAVAYVLCDRLADAATQLKTAVLRDPHLGLPMRNLAVIEFLQGEEKLASEHLEKVVALDSSNASNLLALGFLADRAQELERAEQYYLRAFEQDPSLDLARNRLGEFTFARGREMFESGQLESAFNTWYQGFICYEEAFFASRDLSLSRRELVGEFLADRSLEAAKDAYLAGRKAGTPSEELCYQLFTRFFFSLGMIPEVYCPQDLLTQEVERWQKQFSASDGVFPFPHFRLAIIYCYQGKLDIAATEFSHCRDHLPHSKQKPLKLEEILSFVNEIADLKVDSISLVVGRVSDQHWEKAGFSDPFQLQAWKKTGFSPDEAALWKAAGLSPATSANWARGQFAPNQAQRWLQAGWEDAKSAERWVRAEFSPIEARNWAQQFAENFELAIQCRQVGFDNPEEAGLWMKIFMFPWDAVRWKEMGFSTKEAAVYVAEGVKDPLVAFNQKAAQLRSEYAAREYAAREYAVQELASLETSTDQSVPAENLADLAGQSDSTTEE